jgi:hypothetical protein
MRTYVRLLLIAVVASAAFVPTAAFAGCSVDPTAPGCLPTTAPGTPAPPKTPTPTAKPAPKSTPAPTHHYVPPPVSNTNTGNTAGVSTPEPTAFPIEVVSPTPAATTVIETQTLPGDNQQTLEAQNASSSSSLIIGLIVGLIIGFLIGRASWGIKRRRRQQIFG